MQLDLFSHIDYAVLTEELFTAYFDCRKNKRNTLNALKFEKHLERNVFSLIDEIYQKKYQLGRSIAFIVNKPVTREIFAADFRDRVVHHWLVGKLNPLFENLFIENSYACRVGKGTHYGVQQIDVFIKSCSENYTKDCYILKLDIQGFFMHINRKVLFNMLEEFIHKNYVHYDKALVLEITRKIIFNNPTQNCIIKGHKKDWEVLPKNKSLFHSPPNCGLPIGNLTSQVFANFYMHYFDTFITKKLGLKYYGRYVDDFVIMHKNNDVLKTLIPKISSFLRSTLQLTLHPKKIYLQHYSKGVNFLGTAIKPNRIYIGNRTKGNFYAAVQRHNKIVRKGKPTNEKKGAFLSSMNSYLGIMKHYKTYKVRKKMLQKEVSAYWFNHFYISGGYQKLVNKKRIVKK
jgi:hypothetical protein